MERSQSNTPEELEEPTILPDSPVQPTPSIQSQSQSQSPLPSPSFPTVSTPSPTPEQNAQPDENKAVKMENIRQAIPAEPTTGRLNCCKWNILTTLGDLVRVRVVYPNGTKIQRNFLSSDKLGLLLDLVILDMYDNKMEQKLDELCLTVPRININEVAGESIVLLGRTFATSHLPR